MAFIPFVPSSNRIPLGLSKYAHGKRLVIPLFIRRRRGYSASEDRMVKGMWRFGVCFRTENCGIAIHWGWELLKEHHG